LCFAQGIQSVRGKIVDNKTNEPIVFATVKLVKGQAILGGVVSNADGSFQLPTKALEDADSVVITCIGYSKQVLPTRSFNTSVAIEIRLRPGSVKLAEVVVSAKQVKLSARKIVQFTIENLQQNCPTQPFEYIGYYRDYQKVEDQFVNLNEALVKVYDKGFATNDYDSTKIQLYQYRQNSDFQKDSLLSVPYDSKGKFIPGVTVHTFGGNELSLLRIHDAIRNHNTYSYSFVNELDRDFLNNHLFKLLDTVLLDNVHLYHISIHSRRMVSGGDHFTTGEIFIERGNYGIHKLVYSAFEKTGRKKNNLLYSTNVEYARINGKLYLNYISFNNFFIANSGKGFNVKDITYNRQNDSFVITFNHTPLMPAALYKGAYQFTFQEKPIRIDSVQVSSDNDKVVILSIQKHLFDKFGPEVDVVSKVNTTFKYLRDVDGLPINQTTYRLVNQFREFFLQRVVLEKSQHEKGVYMSKEKRLLQNKTDSGNKEVSTDWMNTPLLKTFGSR
jgi:hypothetical protein